MTARHGVCCRQQFAGKVRLRFPHPRSFRTGLSVIQCPPRRSGAHSPHLFCKPLGPGAGHLSKFCLSSVPQSGRRVFWRVRQEPSQFLFFPMDAGNASDSIAGGPNAFTKVCAKKCVTVIGLVQEKHLEPPLVACYSDCPIERRRSLFQYPNFVQVSTRIFISEASRNGVLICSHEQNGPITLRQCETSEQKNCNNQFSHLDLLSSKSS
jgi:hypothetical protein